MSNNKPTHIVFHIKQTNQVDADTGYKKGLWNRIGAGWALSHNRINIKLDYMPTCEGTIQIVSVDELEDKS